MCVSLLLCVAGAHSYDSSSVFPKIIVSPGSLSSCSSCLRGAGHSSGDHLVSVYFIYLAFLDSSSRGQPNSLSHQLCYCPAIFSHRMMSQASMELSALQMCGLQLRMEFEDDSDFGGYNNLAGECSIARISGSPYAPSTYDPQTPSSGCSTPIRLASLDYTSSLATPIDTSLDRTPPSSKTPTYLLTTMEASSQTTDFVYLDLSFIPPRGQLDFSGHTFGNCGTQIESSQPANSILFVSNYASQSFSVPTTLSGYVDQLSDSLWVQTDIPINFDERSPPRPIGPGPSTVKIENGTDDIISPMSFSMASRRRIRVDEAQLRSTALQQAQQTSPTLSTAQVRFKTESDAKEPRALVMESGCVTIENIQTGKFKCPYEGCKTRPYRRNEHLKRHIQW